jgi:hypothetical protein
VSNPSCGLNFRLYRHLLFGDEKDKLTLPEYDKNNKKKDNNNHDNSQPAALQDENLGDPPLFQILGYLRASNFTIFAVQDYPLMLGEGR